MADLMIQKLRNNEYFGLQTTFNTLYNESKNGRYFTDLYELIISEENILLAFRNLKSNTGSKTKGVNGHTVKHLNKMNADKLIRLIRRRLENYSPNAVRRLFVPKTNGKMRPLGIPTIEDRPESKREGTRRIRHQLVKLRKSPTPKKVMNFNANILGLQNYYKIATRISLDFNEIRHNVHPNIKSLLYRNIFVRTKETNGVIDKFYGDYNYPRFKSNGLLVYPIEAVRYDIRGLRKPEFTIYNEEDRKAIHKDLKQVSIREIEMFRKGIYKSKSVLYENNRLSKYVAQKGCCGITGERLTPHQAICHHIKPTAQGGTDEYDNLMIINKQYHMLIHNSDPLTNKEYQKILSKFEVKAMNKLNRLRTEVGNPKLSL